MDWCLVLAPLAVLAIVALFGFAGCHFQIAPLPETGKDYRENILAEPSLVAYWRLGDAAPASFPAPGAAKDEKDLHGDHSLYGTYDLQPIKPGATPAQDTVLPDLERHSPDGPFAAVFRAPGLLAQFPHDPCVRTNGLYVQAPFDPALNTDVFTFEAWVALGPPDPGDPGNFRCLVDARGKNTGFAILIGPESPLANPPSGLPRWQVWIGDGAQFKVIVGKSAVQLHTTYVALTYDGATVTLYLWYAGMQVTGTPPPMIEAQQGFTGYRPNTDQPLLVCGGRNLFPQVLGTARPVLYPFNAWVQEVALYDLPLDITEAGAHWIIGGGM